MLAHPPREPAWLSWTGVAVWTALIYYTITRAREIQAFVADHLGREWFTYAVLLVIAMAVGRVVRELVRARTRPPWPHGVWMGAVVIGFVAWTWKLKSGSPEEALHFVEDGYLHRDPAYGAFRSRLTLAALEAEDRARAMEAGAILDQYHAVKAYPDFLDRYPEFVDPFLHEIRVRLHRRDAYRNKAKKLRDTDPGGSRFHSTVAYRENGLAERYWPHTMSNTIFRLTRETVAGLRAAQDADFVYESAVSRTLITGCSPSAMAGWGGLALLAWTVGWGYVYWRSPVPPVNPVDS